MNATTAERIVEKRVAKDDKGSFVEMSRLEANSRKAKEQVLYTGFIAQDVEKAAKSVIMISVVLMQLGTAKIYTDFDRQNLLYRL